MLLHYLMTTLRHLFRHRLFAAITITGLAVGLACSVLIGLYVFDELGFDRFHRNGERIYRVIQSQTTPGEEVHLPYVGPGTGPALMGQVSGIEDAVRLGMTAPVMLGYEERYKVPSGTVTYYATDNIFQVFTFSLESGNPTTALTEPFTIVLSQSLARQLFADANPIGQHLYFNVHGRDRQPLQVTGILADVPANSHLKFEALVSFATLERINRNNPDWTHQSVATYLMLERGQKVAPIEAQLHDFMVNHAGESLASSRVLRLQPLLDIHLHSEELDSDTAIRGDFQLVLLLLAIAAGIIAMASINFMNLSTAGSTYRSREIGVRKSFGASHGQLVSQFLGESLVSTIMALLVGLLIVEGVLPRFNDFTGKALEIPYGETWWLLLVFAGVVGLLSGAYPALFLSFFKPIDVFRAQLRGSVKSRTPRRFLVWLQFCLATLLFIGTGVVYQQLNYIQAKNLGLKKEGVVQTVIPSNTPEGNDRFRLDLFQHPRIEKFGRAVVRPLYDMQSSYSTRPALAEINGQMILANARLRLIEVGYGFVETFEMRLLAGRSFSPERPTDATTAFVLNETGVRALGWSSPEEAVGKTLDYDDQEGTIIGVVADFNFESLHAEILPFVMRYNQYSPMVFIKVAPDDMAKTIAFIQRTWDRHSTSKESFHYQFMQDIYDLHYAPERRLQTLLTSFAGLAILITSLGVLGLTLFTVEQRKKEIGIRKVLGATVPNLIGLVSREILQLLLLANFCVWPLAYYVMQGWLANFAYRMDLGVGSFVAAGILVAVITLGTMGFQSARAAMTNPVQTLRHQ